MALAFVPIVSLRRRFIRKLMALAFVPIVSLRRRFIRKLMALAFVQIVSLRRRFIRKLMALAFVPIVSLQPACTALSLHPIVARIPAIEMSTGNSATMLLTMKLAGTLPSSTYCKPTTIGDYLFSEQMKI